MATRAITLSHTILIITLRWHIFTGRFFCNFTAGTKVVKLMLLIAFVITAFSNYYPRVHILRFYDFTHIRRNSRNSRKINYNTCENNYVYLLLHNMALPFSIFTYFPLFIPLQRRIIIIWKLTAQLVCSYFSIIVCYEIQKTFTCIDILKLH